jgi:hypothetical protein
MSEGTAPEDTPPAPDNTMQGFTPTSGGDLREALAVDDADGGATA